jgi:DNA segregation ATPase FtsK/SpoIIIE-like protein
MLLTSAHAQELPAAAAEALGQAQRSAAAALIEYAVHTPDRPLWAEALRSGRAAADAAPTHPAPQRFLAQAYQQVGFYARAWTAWTAYRAFGGSMDAVAERHVIEVARWMGIAAFDGGRRIDAIPYFEALLEFAPFDEVANERLARTYLEQGEPLRARPYLEALDGSIPDLVDDLVFVRRLDAYGDAATQAFEAGLAATAAGAPAAALDRYLEATRAAPGFVDAWRAVVDTALALGREGVAAEAVEQLLVLVPDDPQGLAARAGLDQAESDRIAAEEAAAEQERAAAEAAARLAAEREAAAAAAEREAAAAEAERQAAAAAEAEREAAAEAAARAAAEAEAARNPADEEDARAAAEAEAAAQAAAQAEAERLAAQAEAERRAAQEEAARLAAQEEAARLAAEQEAARVAAEQEAARAATERAAATTLMLGDVGHTHRVGDAAANPAIAYLTAPGLRIDLAPHVDDVLHVRVTVLERPGDDPLWFQLCLVPPDVAVAPACTAPDLVVLGAAGTYEASVRWRDLQGASAVEWRNGIDALMWVLRRPDGAAISGSGDDAARYLPTTLRVRAVATDAGAALPTVR